MDGRMMVVVAGMLAGCAANPDTRAVEQAALMKKEGQWFETCAQGMGRSREVTLAQYRAEGRWQWHRVSHSGMMKGGDEGVLTCDHLQAQRSVTGASWLFVGYGRLAPAMGMDDYGGRDVTGQTVILLGESPVLPDAMVDSEKALASSGRFDGREERSRLNAALRRGAALVVMVVSEERWRQRQQFPEEMGVPRVDDGQVRQGLVVWIAEATWQRWMRKVGQDFVAMKYQATRPDFRPVALPLESTAEWSCLSQSRHFSVPPESPVAR